MTADTTIGDLGVMEPTATDHAIKRYLPDPSPERSGIALCMSGGGYRATLFDLGAMRRLDELGVLSQISTFTAVSGGSIAAAFLAAHLIDNLGGTWPAAGERIPNFDAGVATPLRKMAEKNVRTEAALARFNPRNVRRQNAAADVLEAQYERNITTSGIRQLPEEPAFVFCATDLTFRRGWWVDSRRQRAGNDLSGWVSTSSDYWTIARAVAASSCFPGVFPPMEVDVSRATGVDPAVEKLPGSKPVTSIDVTDGGVFDNLGVEPVWTDHAVVLVSDASPSFGSSPDLDPIWPSVRPIVALLEQANIVRKRWLISNFLRGEMRGAYWGIASLPDNYGASAETIAYDRDLIENLISQIRIELDAFSPAEIGILENHGYLMADLAIHTHLPNLPTMQNPPLRPPHPHLMNRAVVQKELKSSHKYKLLGRGDWR